MWTPGAVFFLLRLLPANSGDSFIKERMSLCAFSASVVCIALTGSKRDMHWSFLSMMTFWLAELSSRWTDRVVVGGHLYGWPWCILGVFTDSGKSELCGAGDGWHRITERAAGEPISIQQQEGQRNVCRLSSEKAVRISCCIHKEAHRSVLRMLSSKLSCWLLWLWHHHSRALRLPSVQVVNSALVHHLWLGATSIFVFRPYENDSVRWWIFIFSEIAPPYPVPECHGLKRASMTLLLKVALCKVVPWAALGNRTLVLADTPG